MTAPKSVVLYGYQFSTFTQKISLILTFKKIPFKFVGVSDKPPRPELESLGITYRRIPILTIDGDVFLDSSLQSEELERRFTQKDGFDSLWPGETSALAPILYSTSRFLSDKAIFSLTAALLPSSVWQDQVFLKDREAFRDEKIDPQKIQDMMIQTVSSLQAHFFDLEKQLEVSKKKFLLGDKPCFLDISYYFNLKYLKDLHKGDESSPVSQVLRAGESSTPLTLEWLEKMDGSFEQLRDYLKGSKQEFLEGDAIGGEKTTGEVGQRLVEDGEKKQGVWIDGNDALIRNGWFKEGDEVLVRPDDSGKGSLQAGRLVGLTSETGTQEIRTSSDKVLNLHFPRHGYILSRKE